MNIGSESAARELARVQVGPHVVTIGNFDGVHRGHLLLIELVRTRAHADSTRSLVVTFEPHPASVLRPDAPFERLTSPEAKRRLLEATGVDNVAVIPFDRAFSTLSPEGFLRLLTDAVQPTAVFVGEGFRFGHGRSGDGSTIETFGRTAGFDARVVTRLSDGEQIISSSLIRGALHSGRLADAANMLGRRYRISGTVEHGVARGRELGYPTANLHLPGWTCVPKDGIYAGYAHIDARHLGARQAMIYIGTRPTFDSGERLVEVNILDFSGDLYTLDLEIEFVEFVREDAAFDSVEDLVRQIADDESTTRALLGADAPEND